MLLVSFYLIISINTTVLTEKNFIFEKLNIYSQNYKTKIYYKKTFYEKRLSLQNLTIRENKEEQKQTDLPLIVRNRKYKPKKITTIEQAEMIKEKNQEKRIESQKNIKKHLKWWYTSANYVISQIEAFQNNLQQ